MVFPVQEATFRKRNCKMKAPNDAAAKVQRGCRLALALLVTTCTAMSAGSAARAEAPMSTYRAMQDKAPEALRLKVLSVNQQVSRSETHDRPGQTATVETISLTISAQVEQIIRSASGLTPGATITIGYQITKRTPPLPGGHQAILLEPGQHVVAYLARATGSTYQIAAYGESFARADNR
jgi:hypothetical protein